MSEFENIVTENFLAETQESIKVLDNELQYTPMSQEQRIESIMKEVRKSLKFGIQKGVFISECTSKKLNSAKVKSIDNWCMSFISDWNDSVLKKNKKS